MSTSSLRSLKLKLLTGYLLLVMLFGVVLTLLVYERRKVEQTTRRTEELVEQRAETERILLDLLDLAFQGEQSVGWETSDMEAYRSKSDSVGIALDNLRLHLGDSVQSGRVERISCLLDQKEEHLFAVMKDIRALREHNRLVQERIPSVIRQTARQSAVLSTQLQENIEEERRKTGGVKGVFRNKKRAREETDRKNDTLLRHVQNSQTGSLRALADEVARNHEENTTRLVAHVDSLTRRNAILNRQLGRLVSEFGDADRRIREEALAQELFGHKRAFQTVSLLSIVALLCAVLFYILLHRDIRARQHPRLRLEKSYRRNAELLAVRKKMMMTVSHDLRLPLSAICGYADLLPDARRKEFRLRYCAAIKESSERMLTLLNTLLDYYRLDAGKEQPDVTPFRVKRLTDTLAAEYAQQAAAKGLEFHAAYEGDDVVTLGDRNRILQIIGNLLSNAVKFTVRGSISLHVAYRPEELTVEVADTGAGLTDEQQRRIFRPFERLDQADMPEGFGLGLSIALALVELLHGKIRVRSVPAEGSSFSVTLPLPLYTEEKTQQPDNEVPDIILPPDLRVAIVDNDPVLLAMTVEMLSRHEVYADGCRNARELLERIRTVDYDLVVTDIVMSDVTGFELLELLRTSNIADAQDVPVLAMTARAECDTEEFTKAGFAGCIHKPFSRDELFAAVGSCIDTRRQQGDISPDFSVLLNGERNDAEMLCLLAQETETNMTAFSKALHNNNKPTLVALTHHLLSLWELLRIETPLKAFRQLLSDEETTEEAIRAAGERILAAGKRLAEQAADRAKEVRV